MLDIVHICYSILCLHPMSKYDFHLIDWGLQILRSLPKAICYCCLVAKSCLTLRPHGLQHIRFLCALLSLGACSSSRPLSRWCYLTISSSAALFFCLQSFPASGSFPMSWLCIKWPNYWSFNFSISPSIEYSVLIFFRIDWFDLLAVQGTLKRREVKWSEVKMLSRVRLCDPVDCSLPGSSGHEILQARILEWVAISFSRYSMNKWIRCI